MNIPSYHSWIYKTLTNKKLLLYFVILILPFVFRTSFESLINEYLVLGLFKNIGNNLLSWSLILGSIPVSILFFIRYKNSYLISSDYIYLLIIVTFWTIFFKSNQWEYSSFWNNSFFSHICFFYLYVALNLILTISEWVKYLKRRVIDEIDYPLEKLLKPFIKTEKEKEQSELGFYIDASISRKSIQDAAPNRIQHAKNITTKIINGEFEKALAIGITGDWGSGKTSFLELIHHHIEKSEANNLIVVEFNPWNSKGKEQIIEDFFETFKDAISPYSSKLSSQIISYSQEFTDIGDKFWSNIFQKVIDFFNENNTIGEKYEQIDDTLKRLDKKIIVFIDDLDRLDKQEVIEVIKIIRNTANFYNTCFIVAYDRGYIIEAIEDFNPYKKDFFLEKIFQVEVQLPEFEDDTLRKNLIKQLAKQLHEADETELSQILPNDYILKTFVTNVRDINRYCNTLIINLANIEKDINLTDFLRLELIRYKYPNILNHFYNNRNHYISLIDLSPEGGSEYYYLMKDNFKNYLSTLNEEYNISNRAERHITEIFNMLLNKSSRQRYDISDPRFFTNYFINSISKKSISNEEFLHYREKTLEEFLSQLQIWISEGKSEDLEYRLFEITNFRSKQEYLNVVKGVFYYIKNTVPYFQIDHLYYNLQRKLRYKTSLSIFSSKQEFDDFIFRFR